MGYSAENINKKKWNCTKKPILMQVNVLGEIEKRWGSAIKMMKKIILVVTWTRVGLAFTGYVRLENILHV